LDDLNTHDSLAINSDLKDPAFYYEIDQDNLWIW